MSLTDKKLKSLEKIANTIRQDIIKMLFAAGSGHSAGPLGMADVFTALYFHVLKNNPKKPWESGRDRCLLSNAHICPVQYATLARRGYFPVSKLKTLRKLGSPLQGHPHYRALPGLENTGGPISQGQSIAVGMALAAKMDKKKHQVYCLVGDGGQNEGQTWEAVLCAGKYKLDNLTFIMDRNNIQIDGYTEDVMPIEPLADKYIAFGWHVIEVDGHNIRQIIDACGEAEAIFEKPVMILAHTIPGKGVDFMEWKYQWHGKVPNKEEAKEALKQLRKL
ncbi:MAG: transketolase [Parcubacteria group bacterium]|nr:transketolase [Parcubacteria group bacterium]